MLETAHPTAALMNVDKGF